MFKFKLAPITCQNKPSMFEKALREAEDEQAVVSFMTECTKRIVPECQPGVKTRFAHTPDQTESIQFKAVFDKTHRCDLTLSWNYRSHTQKRWSAPAVKT